MSYEPRSTGRKMPSCRSVERSHMLRDLDDRTVELLAQRSTMATYEKGELLHRAGEPMDAVVFLNEGRAKVYRMSAEGKQQTLVLLGPGDAFGAIGMVDVTSQDLFVEAFEHVVVCKTTREVFHELADGDPDLGVHLAEAMGEKLQTAREQIASFAFRDVCGRVAHLLLVFLERDRRIVGDDGLARIVHMLTHREIAAVIGSRRESVTTALLAMERDGLIATDAKEIIVLDMDELIATAEF